MDYLKLLNDMKRVVGPTFNFCLAGRCVKYLLKLTLVNHNPNLMLLRAQTVKTLRCRGTFQGAGAQAQFIYCPDATKTFQEGKKPISTY